MLNLENGKINLAKKAKIKKIIYNSGLGVSSKTLMLSYQILKAEKNYYEFWFKLYYF